jgi:hypothetical protein
MAKLKNPVLGNISGTVGDIVFTEKGDSTFLYQKTDRTGLIATPAMILARQKFKLASLITTGINKTDELKKFWPANRKLRIIRFNNILQANYHRVNTIADLGDPILVPGYGFQVQNVVITPTASGLIFASDAPGIGSGINFNKEKMIFGAGIVVLRSPIKEAESAFKVLRLKTGIQPLDLNNPIILSNNYVADELTVFQNYTDKKFFFILITLNSEGVPVHHSVQFSH